MTSTPPSDETAKRIGINPETLPQFLPHKLGIDIIDWNPQRLVATMPVAGNRHVQGVLHGGADAVLAETLGSVAATLNAPSGSIAMGLELSCTHHRAATSGLVTGVCTPLHAGRTTATYEIVISDDNDDRTCTARLTCIVRAVSAQ